MFLELSDTFCFVSVIFISLKQKQKASHFLKGIIITFYCHMASIIIDKIHKTKPVDFWHKNCGIHSIFYML